MTTLDCPHEDDCGACALLGETADQQAMIKGQILIEALEQSRDLPDSKRLPTLRSPRISGYRNRAKMAVGLSKDGTVRLGYFRAKSREVIDAPECRVLEPALLETTRQFRRFLRDSDRVPRELRHIDLRCGTDPGRQHLVLVVRSDKKPQLPLDAIQKACPQVNGISLNLNPDAGPQVIKGRIEPLRGAREVFVQAGGLRLRISPGSFFQVNLALLDPIHDRMRKFLDGGRVLLDLYAGVGTHGLILNRNFERVVLVEGVRASVADAKDTIGRHRLGRVQVVSRAVERSRRKILEAEADCVVMNPSRAGARPAVIETLVSSRAERIAYLSCDPETLSRDIEGLAKGGFRVVSVQPIDMMPQTRQVEALAFLAR